jgi:DNA polymerase III delta prime subunit
MTQQNTLNWGVKYRPQNISDLRGNSNLKKTFKSWTKKGFPQMILLDGSTGAGKTTVARLIAKAIDSEWSSANFEINIAERGNVETMRTLAEESRVPPMYSKYKVYILDECHTLSKQAASSLLKVFEDTPEHCHWILATDQPHKLLDTIRNRANRLTLESPPSEDMVDLLWSVMDSEKIEFDSFFKKHGGDKSADKWLSDFASNLITPRLILNSFQVAIGAFQEGSTPTDAMAIAIKSGNDQLNSAKLLISILSLNRSGLGDIFHTSVFTVYKFWTEILLFLYYKKLGSVSDIAVAETGMQKWALKENKLGLSDLNKMIIALNEAQKDVILGNANDISALVSRVIPVFMSSLNSSKG